MKVAEGVANFQHKAKFLCRIYEFLPKGWLAPLNVGGGANVHHKHPPRGARGDGATGWRGQGITAPRGVVDFSPGHCR